MIEDVNTLNLKKLYNAVDFSPLRNRSILITGASGLLGSNLLFALDWALSSDVSKITAVVQTKKTEFYPKQKAEVIYANLSNPDDCARLPYADFVISAASYAQPMRFMSEPLGALRSSAYGVMTLLERVKPGGRFMFISSSEVYCGCKDATPLTENSIGQITPYHPRACYIQGKMFGEAITYLYRQRGISTVSVRPGIIFGAGVRPGDMRSWASFIERVVRTGRIELMDRGDVVRSFTYMQDGIEMLLNALLYGREEVYNITSNYCMKIREIAMTIARAAGGKLLIPKEDHGVAGTPDNLTLSNERYCKEFDKKSFITIEEGIEKTVEWWRDVYA